jgi:adenosine 3'-phospho 5'-phosphosulfate transporter B3
MADTDEHCPSTPSKPTTSMTGTLTPSSRNNGVSANNLGAILSNKLDALPRSVQFVIMALFVFLFFGIHNVLQEAMINTEGFKFGVMLGWMEVLGVTLCSGIERSSIPFLGNGESRRPRSAPLIAYPPLTLCLLMSSSLASWSLNYINFPTKVVFRSCKLLPTMIIAVVMGNAKRFSLVEVASAIAVCAGLITFAAGDWNLSNPQFHPFGLTLVTMSVFADAILPNAQEKLFKVYDASKSEVMFFTNVFTFMIQTCSAMISGDLVGMFYFMFGQSFSVALQTDFASSEKKKEMLLNEGTMNNRGYGQVRYTFLTYVIAYILMSHIAVSAHTAVVKKFGGVAAVFVGTARKGMTLVLSVSPLETVDNIFIRLTYILIKLRCSLVHTIPQRKQLAVCCGGNIGIGRIDCGQFGKATEQTQQNCRNSGCARCVSSPSSSVRRQGVQRCHGTGSSSRK